MVLIAALHAGPMGPSARTDWCAATLLATCALACQTTKGQDFVVGSGDDASASSAGGALPGSSPGAINGGSAPSGQAVPLAPPVPSDGQGGADSENGAPAPPVTSLTGASGLPAVPPPVPDRSDLGEANATDEPFVFVPAPYDPPQLAYAPSAEFLLDPELAVGFVTSCADFWQGARDDENGGYFTHVDVTGMPSESDTNKWFVGQSRNAYGFTRAFMLSGNEQYLDHARHALDFLYAHAWDAEHGGWFGWGDRTGAPLDAGGDKWSFNQHYALLGPATMCEATRDPLDCDWLERGVQLLDDGLYDHEHGGYFNYAARDFSSARGKGFTPTADAITTHALYAYLVTGRDDHRARFLSLADDLADHLVASMDHEAWVFGFAEEFESDWSLGSQSAYGLVGHVFKAAWSLARAYLIEPDEKYREAARRLLDHMYQDGGFDRDVGAPNFDFTWNQGLMGRNKEFWQVEQAITSGFINYYINQDTGAQARYLEIGDRSLDFFMRVLRDPEYGEIFSMANESGTEIIDHTKGGQWKAAYHSTETGYYAYLYGNLMYWRRPVSLHYRFTAQPEARELRLTPLAIEDDQLIISAVTRDGQAHHDFDPTTRTLRIPADQGGVYRVTYHRL